MKKRKKKRYKSGLAESFIALHHFLGCYFACLTCVASVQVQPLSLEELLAKKKAEEEAEAKVRSFLRFTFDFSF